MLPEHDSCHLLNKKVCLRQASKGGLRAGIDCVLLAAVPIHGKRVLELGCAVGQTLLCYGLREIHAELLGIEIQTDLVSLARANAIDNQMDHRLQIIQGDFTDKYALQKYNIISNSFDLVLMNPPYFVARHHTVPLNQLKKQTHIEQTPLNAWINCALSYVKQFGHIALIHRPDRLTEILYLLTAKRAGAIRVMPIYSRVGKVAYRIIVIAQKSRKGVLNILPPLVMHTGNTYTLEAKKILEQAERLPITI